MALFQKQDSCSSNKATTACRHSASSLRSPPGLHSREGRYTEIKMPFAPPAMCRLTIYKDIMYGYDAVAKLSENEWKAIPYVVITNQFISTAWFSEQEKHKELYETNRKMTEWMLQNFDNMVFE